MSKISKTITTRLESAVDNGDSISQILDNKLEEYQLKKMPVEASLADYINMGIGSFDEKIAQYEAYKKDLTEAIKAFKELKQETSIEVGSWMKSSGIEKLKGINVSSITIKDASVSVTNKIKRDISDGELVELGYAHYEEDIKEIPQTIKINKKRT